MRKEIKMAFKTLLLPLLIQQCYAYDMGLPVQLQSIDFARHLSLELIAGYEPQTLVTDEVSSMTDAHNLLLLLNDGDFLTTLLPPSSNALPSSHSLQRVLITTNIYCIH